MIIKVLGTGCAKCRQLEENVRQAINNTGIQATLLKITDLDKIMDHGVMITPALVIDEEPVASGKLLSTADIEAMLKQLAAVRT